MSKFKGTKAIKKSYINMSTYIIEDEKGEVIVKFRGVNKTQHANFELFKDALNTIQKCDQLPSELLFALNHEKKNNEMSKDFISQLKKQRGELKEFILKLIEEDSIQYQSHHKEAQELLNKINND